MHPQAEDDPVRRADTMRERAGAVFPDVRVKAPDQIGANKEKSNVVLFEKELDDTYYLVVEYRRGRHRLAFKTMYKRAIQNGEGAGRSATAIKTKPFPEPDPSSNTD